MACLRGTRTSSSAISNLQRSRALGLMVLMGSIAAGCSLGEPSKTGSSGSGQAAADKWESCESYSGLDFTQNPPASKNYDVCGPIDRTYTKYNASPQSLGKPVQCMRLGSQEVVRGTTTGRVIPFPLVNQFFEFGQVIYVPAGLEAAQSSSRIAFGDIGTKYLFASCPNDMCNPDSSSRLDSYRQYMNFARETLSGRRSTNSRADLKDNVLAANYLILGAPQNYPVPRSFSNIPDCRIANADYDNQADGTVVGPTDTEALYGVGIFKPFVQKWKNLMNMAGHKPGSALGRSDHPFYCGAPISLACKFRPYGGGPERIAQVFERCAISAVGAVDTAPDAFTDARLEPLGFAAMFMDPSLNQGSGCLSLEEVQKRYDPASAAKPPWEGAEGGVEKAGTSCGEFLKKTNSKGQTVEQELAQYADPSDERTPLEQWDDELVNSYVPKTCGAGCHGAAFGLTTPDAIRKAFASTAPIDAIRKAFASTAPITATQTSGPAYSWTVWFDNQRKAPSNATGTHGMGTSQRPAPRGIANPPDEANIYWRAMLWWQCKTFVPAEETTSMQPGSPNP